MGEEFSLGGFLEKYASFLLIFGVGVLYLIGKKFLSEKRFENRKNLYEPPEEIARLTIESYRKKNPEMLTRFANLSIIKELVNYCVTNILNVPRPYLTQLEGRDHSKQDRAQNTQN